GTSRCAGRSRGALLRRAGPPGAAAAWRGRDRESWPAPFPSPGRLYPLALGAEHLADPVLRPVDRRDLHVQAARDVVRGLPANRGQPECLPGLRLDPGPHTPADLLRDLPGARQRAVQLLHQLVEGVGGLDLLQPAVDEVVAAPPVARPSRQLPVESADLIR